MHNEMSLMTLILVLFDTSAGIVIIFVTCEYLCETPNLVKIYDTQLVRTCLGELGQRGSNAFDEIADEFDKFNWYRFPNKIKRILPLIMVVTQKPVVIECFGSITCCRDVLKTVSSTISYTYGIKINFIHSF